MADLSGFIAYKTDLALDIVPGRPDRTWMDETAQRFVYRCLPLTIANSSGWELLSPCNLEATWNGDAALDAIRIRALDGFARVERVASSHFGGGVLTFRTGYLFRTSPGWGLLVRGAPNHFIDGIYALEGLVETDWLSFHFTMNWLFTRPGTVVFEKGTPLAFVTPVEHRRLDDMQPTVQPLSANPELEAEYAAWAESRKTFNRDLRKHDPEAVKQGWQRNYMRGRKLDGTPAPAHITKRKLKRPVVLV